MTSDQSGVAQHTGSALSVLLAFLKLGLMSFGGPVAHLGYFREEFLERRKWVDEATYVDLVSNGWIGGFICLLAIYLPSFLLLIGTLPFWNDLRGRTGAKAALAGVNAAVVGLLVAALYTPVWTSAIERPAHFAIALAAFLLLMS